MHDTIRLKLLLGTLPILFLPTAAMYGPTLSGPSFWIVDFFVTLFPAAVCVFVFSRMGVSAHDLGLGKPRGVNRTIWITVACTIGYLAFVPITNIAAAVLDIPPPESQGGMNDRYIPGSLGLLAIAYSALSAGLAEEIMFRGVLATIFIRDRTAGYYATYVLVSAALFTAAHLATRDPADLVGILYIGLFSSLVYLRVGNLWPLIFGHVMLDGYVFYRVFY